MRVLLVGTVPPPPGRSSAALGAIAAELVERGDTLEVWSPDRRSVAHRHLPLSGVGLGIRLALVARRFDAVVLRIEAGVPLASDATRLERGLALLALGAGLSLHREVTLRLDTPVPIPGGLGGRATKLLWSSASAITVANEEDRTELLAAPGVRHARVVVEDDAGEAPEEEMSFDHLDDGAGREAVLEVVRERSRRTRAIDDALVELNADRSAAPRAKGAVRASAWAWCRAALRRARREFARS